MVVVVNTLVGDNGTVLGVGESGDFQRVSKRFGFLANELSGLEFQSIICGGRLRVVTRSFRMAHLVFSDWITGECYQMVCQQSTIIG